MMLILIYMGRRHFIRNKSFQSFTTIIPVYDVICKNMAYYRIVSEWSFSVRSTRIGIPPLQLADLPTVYTTTNQKSSLDPAFYAKRGTQETS